jgi:hypothetical protein
MILAGWLNLLVILFGVVTVIVHIGFAIHVAVDASALERERRLIFGPAALWVLKHYCLACSQQPFTGSLIARRCGAIE